MGLQDIKKSAQGITPYALSYGHDAVLPMEVAARSLVSVRWESQSEHPGNSYQTEPFILALALSSSSYHDGLRRPYSL